MRQAGQGMAAPIAERLATRREQALRLLRSPYALPVALSVALQLLVLAAIRLFAADPAGGDLCRDVVTVSRLLAGQNPYTPIAICGVLRHTPHTPASLLLITPFMLLPIPLAGLLWDLLALVALGAALALIAGELQLRPRPWQVAALLAFVAVWPPLLNTLLNAQVSPLLLLLYALAWRWTRRGQSAAAGAALGFATALRLFPGLLVLYFALRRDWRLVGAALATFAASSLVLLPVIGPGAYWDYIARETPAATADWIASQHNTSLAGLAYHLLGADASAATLLGRLLTVALLLALVAITWMRRHVPFVRDEATFLAYVPAALLATPILWQHYFVVLLLPLAVLGARLGLLSAPPASPVATIRLRCVAGLALASLALIEIGYALQMFAFPRPLAALASAGVDGPPTYALLAILVALLLLPAAAPARARPRSGPVPQVAGIRYNL